MMCTEEPKNAKEAREYKNYQPRPTKSLSSP